MPYAPPVSLLDGAGQLLGAACPLPVTSPAAAAVEEHTQHAAVGLHTDVLDPSPTSAIQPPMVVVAAPLLVAIPSHNAAHVPFVPARATGRRHPTNLRAAPSPSACHITRGRCC